MQKRVPIIIFLLIVLVLPFMLAADGDAQKIALANSCLKDKIEERTCDTLSTPEKAFSVLAVNECKAELLDDSSENECWPNGNCDVITTAQAVFALQKNSNTNKAEEWLTTQNATASEMQWLLQIDPNGAASCTIRYGGSSYTTTIDEDEKVEAGAGSCLSVDDTGFWLKINPARSLGCYTRDYEISCETGFSTNLLYKKPDSTTIHVAEITSSASAGGATNESVDAYCFLKGGSCDYESTLWGALALNAVDKNIDPYLPYLITFADEQINQQYLPQAFLYLLTNAEDFRNALLLKQKENKYWSESGDRFYDTAVALYPLKFEDPFEKQNAVNWLLESQDQQGCWQGNIVNTGFILATLGEGEANTTNASGSTTYECEDQGYFCMGGQSCLDAGGNVLDYQCGSTFKCCSVQEQEKSCAVLQGEICSSAETCVGGRVEDASGLGVGEVCCIQGSCEEEQQEQDQNQCEFLKGTCSLECGENEEQFSYSCTYSGDVCCFASASSGGKKSSGGSLWIWILVILIILTILAILFREKLKIFWIKIKSKFGGSKRGPGTRGPPRRPGPPPSYAPGLRRRAPPAHHRESLFRRPVKKGSSNTELDDVLKKLKDIGK